MSAVSFDTLKFAQTLRDKAGVPQPQTEGIAEAFAAATGEQIATKGDLKELELRLEARFTKLEEKVDGRSLLLQRMMGFVLAMLVALLFLALRH